MSGLTNRAGRNFGGPAGWLPRPIERELEGRTDPEAEVMRGYCDAVRSALTDDGRPPLEASGLKLHDRLSGITASLERVAEKRGYPRNCNG